MYFQGWLVTKLRKLPNSSSSERLISIDCEMVRCEDGSEEVVKVCVVDQNLEVNFKYV
jgi:RNA exonuclease 1